MLVRQRFSGRNGQRGVTMIEVLVSIIIVAIGILGLTALQAVSLRNVTSSSLRSTASILSRDMADRMRANKVGRVEGSYNALTGTPADPGCISSGCTTAQMAAYDYWRWNTEVSNSLPSGRGMVCLDASPEDGTPAAPACSNSGTSFVIKIWWDDNRQGASNLKRLSTVVNP